MSYEQARNQANAAVEYALDARKKFGHQGGAVVLPGGQGGQGGPGLLALTDAVTELANAVALLADAVIAQG